MEKNKKKALLILTRAPYPEVDGTRKRMMDVIRGAAKDFSLDLLIVGDEKLTSQNRLFLEGFFGNIHVYFLRKVTLYFQAVRSFFSGRPLQTEYYFNKKVSSFILEKINEYDVIYLHTIRLGRYLELFDEETLKKVFLDLNDAISLNYHEAKKLAGFPWNLIYSFEEERVKKYETKLLSLVSNANVVSSFDERYLRSNCEKKGFSSPKFHGILPGVELHDKVILSDLPKNQIVFFGNINYPPNKDAVRYFVANLWPSLEAKVKNASFVIAGNGSESLRLPHSAGIKKIGFVRDLRDLFTDAIIVVAPIRFGAGVPTKILEALSYGVPVITTPIGIRGMVIDGEEGEFGIKCLDLKDSLVWVDFIDEIASNRDKREIMANAGINFIKKNYQQDVTREKYRAAFNFIANQ